MRATGTTLPSRPAGLPEGIDEMKDYAYFCARCASAKTDASNAERLASSLGLELWKPSDKVSFTFPEGAQECRDAIDGAAAVICQPPIGNDCSWELGYAVG